MRVALQPEIRAALLAARWAQEIGLRPGNLWEPAVARNILAEYQRTECWAFVEAMYRMRLGLLEDDKAT